MPTSFLTQEGYNKLQDELDHLRTEKRQEIADRLHEALDGGELIENAEYEAAKNEQAFVEGRIKELEILLATARIISEDLPHELIRVGITVTVQADGEEAEVYEIVGAAESDPMLGKISNESPLGKALMNHKVGEIVQVEAPSGAFKVRICKIE
jgi:transcription elongation factor GreA